MMCSGTGGNGKALKACDVGDEVGDEDADDVGESIIVTEFRFFKPDATDIEYAQGFADRTSASY